jgi:hypothetical protein
MTCPGCGHPVPEGAEGGHCPSCGAPLADGAGTHPGPSGPEGVPWENRLGLGWLPALLATLRRSLFEPDRFFSGMQTRGNLGSAIGYAIVVGWAGMIGGLFWNLIFQGAQTALLRRLGAPSPGEMSAGIKALLEVAFALAGPVVILAALFIWGGILHLCLMLVGGARGEFETTLRVYAYSMGPALFQWIPLCGGLIGFVWGIVLQIIGLSKAHGISGGRAAAAVLLPVFLCCACLGLAMAVFFGAIATLATKGGGW